MRIKLGDKIFWCTLATLLNNIIKLRTINGIYEVEMYYKEEAEIAFDNLLSNGYYDFPYDKVYDYETCD